MRHFMLLTLISALSATITFSQPSKIVTTKFYSTSLKRDIPVDVYLPSNYSDSTAAYRLYVYLHGAAGSVGSYLQGLQSTLDDLISRGEIDPMIVVMPTVRFTTVHGKAIPYDLHFYTDSERNGKYASVITLDLLEWMGAHYNVTSRREERAIGGFSMGADNSIRIAARNSDKFIACVSDDGGPSFHAFLRDLKNLLAETPGPPYHYDAVNGFTSSIWLGLAAAYSPNLVNPNMPEWFLDFPFDDQGNLIDSVFTGRWIANHEPAVLIKNPQICPHEIAIFFDSSTDGRAENNEFHADLTHLKIPHTYKRFIGIHGLSPEIFSWGLHFLDSVMDSAALDTVVYVHDLKVKLVRDRSFNLNTYSRMTYTPQAWVQNLGTTAETNVSVVCTITKNGSVEHTETATIDSLNPMQASLVHFKEWRPTEMSNYKLTVSTNMAVDQNASNDTSGAIISCSGLVDDFEAGFQQWQTNGFWGVTAVDNISGKYAMDDVPYISYNNNSDTWAMFCQGAPKMYHLGAVQSVPPLIDNFIRFSWIFSGGSQHVKQVKDGTKRITISPFFTKMVYS